MRLLILSLVLLYPALLNAAPLTWLTDLNAAKVQAQKENKAILLDFTGSDWCHWCKLLKAEVFDTPQFAEYASKQLVLVEVDFPERKRLSAQQMQANATLQAIYKVEGYPTIILLDSTGKLKGKTGYNEGGPTPFLAELNRFIPAAKASAAAPVANGSVKPGTAVRPLVANTNSTMAAKVKITGLELKSIMGSDKMRVALINDQAFVKDEEFKVAVQDKTVTVKCLEISEKQARVLVDGQPATLVLKK